MFISMNYSIDIVCIHTDTGTLKRSTSCETMFNTGAFGKGNSQCSLEDQNQYNECISTRGLITLAYAIQDEQYNIKSSICIKRFMKN